MDWLRVTYLISSSGAEIRARAEALAVEQSVEMPVSAVRDRYVIDHILARVESIEPASRDRYKVVIRIAAETTGYETGQLLNMLFGNASLQEDVELVDAELPPSLLSAFPGPRWGIPGIRTLVSARGRALTGTALKPQGLPSRELAALCRTFALAGIDVIKDDHGLADQAYAPFAERVQACQRAVDQANRATGRQACYAPSLSGSPKTLAEQARIAREEGVRMVLAAPMLMGMPTFGELVREHLDLPVLAHPALGGAARIHPPFLFGKLFRLLGADAVIYPNHGGRFSYSRDLCGELAAAMRASWGDVRPALPVPAGGMSIERVPEMLEFYGADTMLLIGGALLTAGDGLLERSRAFVEMVGKQPSTKASADNAAAPVPNQARA